ncbi:nitric oxide reductase activation protein NorD [Nocardia sp. NPDC057353]|uniref:nitric oxide reductase activation protein NorD n=1 Tax=Nocardia sp. NPDC057353 TaxID=3346104 RepID=UPI003631AF0E
MNPRALERGCALSAVAFSARRRANARLITGEHRGFGLNAAGTVVQVPYPSAPGWTRTTLTCGIALQCAPSKDELTRYALHELSPRERGALTLVEGGVAAAWIADRLPGLLPELRLRLPDLPFEPGLDVPAMLERADRLARSGTPLPAHPLLGTLPLSAPGRGALAAAIHRTYGRMPWTSRRSDAKRVLSVPVGGDGGARNSNLPPPSRPDNEDLDIRADRRAGIPYPEWNMWTESFLPDHVAVLERANPTRGAPAQPVGAELRRWFEQRTHRALRGGLPDGSDLDVDRYVAHRLDALGGPVPEPRVFRDLLPTTRDVTTAVLLDGSSSLGSHGGRAFRLELACADALSRAMALARERHGLFVFTGNTRHRVEVRCLKDFDDPRFVDPGGLGLMAGGYTRLGAPLRHLTHRLAERPAERRLLLVIGDGLMSDEGYEGRYAWADVAHALTEADEAGITVYYIGVGPARVDPLPEVFGPRRSCRIHRVEQLPRVLGAVHRALVAA